MIVKTDPDVMKIFNPENIRTFLSSTKNTLNR